MHSKMYLTKFWKIQIKYTVMIKLIVFNKNINKHIQNICMTPLATHKDAHGRKHCVISLTERAQHGGYLQAQREPADT